MSGIESRQSMTQHAKTTIITSYQQQETEVMWIQTQKSVIHWHRSWTILYLSNLKETVTAAYVSIQVVHKQSIRKIIWLPSGVPLGLPHCCGCQRKPFPRERWLIQVVHGRECYGTTQKMFITSPALALQSHCVPTTQPQIMLKATTVEYLLVVLKDGFTIPWKRQRLSVQKNQVET